MADNTNIEWADSTFNPWIGCTKVSPACDHCYAETRMDSRLHVVSWGAGQPRKRTSESNWKNPLRWEKEHKQFYAEHGRRRRVFCASLADVFDNEVPIEWRRDLFDLIELTPNLDWLLLTKRIGNVFEMVSRARSHDWLAGRKNVWLGATICNQAEADRDIPKLLAINANVRFLSIEPLLGAIDILRWLEPTGVHCIDVCPDTHYVKQNEVETYKASGEVIPLCPHCGESASWTGYDPGLDWVIIGGESGTQARPMHPDWVRSLRDQCKFAGVPFLFKQWGEWVDGNNVPVIAEKKIWFDKKLSHIEMESLGLIMDMKPPKPMGPPFFGCNYYIKVGKKEAGRTLDGVTHTEFPEVRHA